MNSVCAVLVALFLRLAGGRDLYWQPNSNWGNPSNWARGRVPGCNDAVSLNLVPADSVVYLDVDATVRSISLPADGQLVLGPSVTIQLSDSDECTVPGNTQPMAAAVENEFIGVQPHYWECAENWLAKDGFDVEHPPCGEDKAVFEQGAFSYVKANQSIFVQSLSVRGTDIFSQAELNPAEFNIKIEINGECSTEPGYCPCPTKTCLKPPTIAPVTTKPPPPAVVKEAQKLDMGGVAGGVVFGIVVIAAVVVVVIILLVLWYKRRRYGAGYVKDELLEDGANTLPASSTSVPYDNPLFDEEEFKVDLAAAGVAKVDLGGAPEKSMSLEVPVYEADPPRYDDLEEPKKGKRKVNEYERF